nr:monodehydroascorbate reductase [Tanacetum cinerariifolium]
TMADVNVNAPAEQAPAMAPPTCTDDQILPRSRWGLRDQELRCYRFSKASSIELILIMQRGCGKNSPNPSILSLKTKRIWHCILRAFTASSTITSIYIQQFWDTVRYDKSVGCYRCQLDEQWFDLTKDTLRDAFQITPVNDNQAFTSSPSTDALINFVNDLGYPKLVRNLSNVVTNDMFQPWRALTTIINLCLTGNTIWEEFTQSIHTFIEDKRNLEQRTHEKKKATLIVIPSIRFTRLIMYHLQRQHKFHPRPDSPLNLPNEEPILGYLKFSAKGTKREFFGMPIPGRLITSDIQEALYYQEYLAKVTKHQRYLAGETRSDLDSPAPKPTKTARKPKPMAPKVHPRPSVSKTVSSTQPEPTSAPAKTQGKKRKLTTEISDKPSKAIKSRHGFVSKKRKPISTLRSVDESVPEDVPTKEPRVDDEEADVQRALEESMKSMYDVPRGPLPPVVIREPESGKYQPLPEVPRKGKEKVIEEQVAHSEEESKEDVPGADTGGQGEGQAGPDPGQARPDPGNAEASQSMPSHVVHAGLDRFTATAYPKVQENLKLTVEERVLLEEHASSLRTLSSMQHLTKDLSFGDLFFSDKPSEADNDRATAETEAKSMVSVMIQQDMSSIPPMTSPIIDLTSRPESPKVHQLLKATATEKTTTTTLLPPPYQQQQSTAEAMMMKRIGELKHIMANLIQENKRLEQRDLPEADMKEILHQQKSMNRDHSEELTKDLAKVRKKKKKSRESPKTPPGSPPHQPPPPPPPAGPFGASGSSEAFGSSQVPPPLPLPPSTNQEGQSKGSTAPSSSKTAASAEHQAWTTTDIRLRSSISLTPADLQIDEDMAPDEQAQSSDDEDIRSAHIPKASALVSNSSPPPEDLLLLQTGDITMFMDWFCKRRGITELKPQDLEGPAFEIIKVFHPDVIHLQYQMEECHKLLTDSVDDSILRHNVSKPSPLGGPPSKVTIQSDFFFNKDLEYLRYGSKGSRPTLSISKMKAAYYPDVGLEQMVPDQIWIEKECKYDIAAIAVRTHMRILSVVRIEVFSMYGYDYKKKIVLRCADLNEHVIAERDFKYLYPSDFEDLYLLNLQEDFQLGVESYQTQLNLTKPRWDTTGFEYKHDYTFIDSPWAIDEALDYRVKEFRINRMNPGLNTRFWTMMDVDRSKDFTFAIQKRLKTRRIFCNLESFVGGRVRDGDYRLLKHTE